MTRHRPEVGDRIDVGRVMVAGVAIERPLQGNLTWVEGDRLTASIPVGGETRSFIVRPSQLRPVAAGHWRTDDELIDAKP